MPDQTRTNVIKSRKKSTDTDKIPIGSPARSIEAQENKLISLAVREAERQLRDGTASSQIITHYLRLATVREQLEVTKLKRETELIEARAESLASAKRIEDLYAEALMAMKTYSGGGSE